MTPDRDPRPPSLASRFLSPASCFLLALFLRLPLVLFTYDWPIGLDDMFQYDMLARSIVAGQGYRWYGREDLALVQQYITMEIPATYDPRGILTSFRAPGYPAFLALVYAVCGAGPYRFFAARLAQAFLGAALAPLTWMLARQAGFGTRVARLAALVAAIYPMWIVYPLALVSENLYIPLLTLALVLTLRAGERGRVRDCVLAGVAFGLAALTRSIITGFALAAAAWVTYRAETRAADRFARAGGLMLAFLLVTLPWAARNTRLHGQPTWVENSLGYNLYVGYHPQSTGTFQYGISLDLLPILDDGERNTRGMEAFWRFVRQAPGRIPYLAVRKVGYLWGLDKRALIYFYTGGYLGKWPAWLLGAALLLTCGPLVLLGPAAIVGASCGEMDRRKAFLVLFVAYSTAIHALILAESRFLLPALPALAFLAASALVERPWRASHLWQKGLAALLIVLLFVNWGAELARDGKTLVALFGPDGHRLYLPY